METNQKKTQKQKQNQYQKKWKLQRCRPRLPTTCEKDAIEFAKKHKDKIAKRGEQFYG
ncbi:DUF1672 family protein [Staphylococcus aureus]